MWSYKMYVVGIVGLNASIPKRMEWKGIGYLQAFYRGGIYPSALNNKGAVEKGFFRFRFLDHHRASKSKHKHLNAATIAI